MGPRATSVFWNHEASVKTLRGSTYLSLVQKIVSNFILKLRNFQTKKVSQLQKDKVCWSKTIFSLWFCNVFPLQILKMLLDVLKKHNIIAISDSKKGTKHREFLSKLSNLYLESWSLFYWRWFWGDLTIIDPAIALKMYPMKQPATHSTYFLYCNHFNKCNNWVFTAKTKRNVRKWMKP